MEVMLMWGVCEAYIEFPLIYMSVCVCTLYVHMHKESSIKQQEHSLLSVLLTTFKIA